MRYVEDILNLREIANDWENLLDDDGNPSDIHAAADALKFELLCSQLSCEKTPDALREYGDMLEPILIRESYFEEYARDLAEDLAVYDRSAAWPLNCIDWEMAAAELSIDYASVDFDGHDFFIRSA